MKLARMAAANKRIFTLEHAADLAGARTFLQQISPQSGAWSVSGSTQSKIPLLEQLVTLANSGGPNGAKVQSVIAVDCSEGLVHVPTSVASFATRSHLPTILIPSLLKENGDANKENTKLGLSLLARGCFFSNAESFELLESLVDDLVKNNKIGTIATSFAGTIFPAESIFATALKGSTSLPMSSCIALATVKEAEVARAMGKCAPAMVGRLTRLLKELGLPNKFDRKLIDTTAVRLLIMSSLRSVNVGIDSVMFLLPTGDFVLSEPLNVPISVIERVIADALTVVPFNMTESTRHCKVRVPGSKSVSNRALLLAGLSEGSCVIRGLLHSDDTQVMMCALEQLGASFTWIENGAGLHVKGNGGKFALPTKPLWMGNAGTATRFVISLCCLVADANHETILEGSHRMEERPQGDLIDALVANGCSLKCFKKQGYLPLAIRGGGFKGGKMTLSGKISSQFVSSVLFASPYAKEPLDLTLAEAEPTSISYIEMTVDTMKEFGVDVKRLAKNRFLVPNDHGYRNPAEYLVEADASSATYALACASVFPGRSVTVLGVGSQSLQGDAQFCQFLGRMGAQVSQTRDASTVTGTVELHPPHSKGASEDMASLTDAFLTGVACAALCPSGSMTHISGIENQHVKECDRIAALVKELGKFNIKCENLPDGIIVHGAGPNVVPDDNVYLDTYDDHRVAMSLAVIGSRIPNLVISDKDCTDKTYPDFWDDLVSCLGTEVKAQPELPVSWVDQSLVLIGMRGAGKTTLGKLAASHLAWPFIDLDEVIVKTDGHSKSCREIVEKRGWNGFRELEFQCLGETLRANPTKHVIACGGGIIEHSGSRACLKEHFPVINIQRDFADIEIVLRPAAPVVDEPTHEAKRVKADAQREDDPNRPRFDEPLDKVYARRKPWLKECAKYDFVVPLSGSLEQLTADWPIIEKDFTRLLDNARKPCSPDNAWSDPLLGLVYPIEAGDDVQLNLSRMRRENPHQVIAVRLNPSALELDIEDQMALLSSAARCGVEGWIMPPRSAGHWKHAAIVRGRALARFGPLRVAEDEEEKDRSWFKPTVEAYPGKAMFKAQADNMYYLFGHPVYASPSPTMHNSAFSLLGHPLEKKRYTIFDSPDASRVNSSLFSANFAGASVTIPHKQAIENLNRISNEAKAIGAINTIVKNANGELLGDNTDWLGIKSCLQLNGLLTKGKSILVVGAGGTARAACFCVREMGLSLFVYNRTEEKANELAREFGGKSIGLEAIIPHLAAIVSTVPATSNWTAPSSWLSSKPLVLDVAYKPRRTALLIQAAGVGCFTVEGIDMLLEQGFEQVKRFQSGVIDKSQLEQVQLSDEVKREIRTKVFAFYEQ